MEKFKLFMVFLTLTFCTEYSCFATTLCDQYGTRIPSIVIGAGTSYPSSSFIGSSYTGTVHITGDFEIDNNSFSFLNCVVKVSPGVKITVNAGFARNFTLNNTKIFACSGLWEGIEVEDLAFFISKNGTKIEDAKKAVFTTANTYIEISNTTFNRNDVGIDMNTSSSFLLVFDNVSFTCTSPLNGTVSDISFAGIKTNNFNLTVGSNSHSPILFDGLQNGIFNSTVSAPKSIVGSNLIIRNIEDDGIYLQYGTLDLDNCTFTNNLTRSATVKIAQDITAKNIDINYDSGLPVPGSLTLRYGFYIGALAPSKCDVEFDNISLNANLTDTTNVILGIYILGNVIGSEPDILIHDSNFDGHSIGGGGIILDGNFPITSKIDIFNNYFTDCNSGIWMVNGNKKNVRIFDNEFEINGSSIIAFGSTGTGNEIINNILVNNNIAGVYLWDFENTNICSNTVSSAPISLLSSAFLFWGTNSGTNFQANTITGTDRGLNFPVGSLVGIQTHKGNRWFDGTGGQRANWHAICQDPLDAPFNKFFVHTAQTVWNGSSYTFFSEYFRENLQPNTTNFFETDLGGTPAGACSSPSVSNPILVPRSPEFMNETDRLIADNQIPSTIHNPARIWNINNYLYRKLKRIPEAVTEYAAFPSFVANQTNSSIGDLYQVAQTMEQAIAGDNAVILEFNQLQEEIRNLIRQRQEINEQMIANTSAAQLEVLRADYLELSMELAALQDDYHGKSLQYIESIKEQFRLAQRSNNQVRANSIFAQNQKNVNDLYLTAYIEQNGEFTEEQVERLKTIALQCPQDGGMAVYMARGLLPIELKEELWNDFLACAKSPTPDFSSPQNDQVQGVPLLESDIESAPFIYPNPTSTAFIISNPKGKAGKITISDLTGKVLHQERIAESTYQTEIIHNLKGGIYLVSIQFSDGTLLTQKLFVQH